MNVGQLFVNLGVKGTEKTVGAITGVATGMRAAASESWKTKAAILAAFYALQSFTRQSNQEGQTLSNLNTLLDTGTDALQRYQWAARKAGVSSEETSNSLLGLQQAMTKILMGKGAPEGMEWVARITGSFDPKDVQKYAEQPQLLLQRLQQYASKETNKGLRNEVLKSFGLGNNMIAALNRQVFTPQNLASAPTYNKGEVAALADMESKWAQIIRKFEMGVGKLNAKFGPDIVKDIETITNQVLKLADALLTLIERFGVMEKLGDIFKGWTQLLQGDLSKTISETAKEQYGDDSALNQLKVFGKGLFGIDGDNSDDIIKKGEALQQQKELQKKAAARIEALKNPALPSAGAAAIPSPPAPTSSTQVNNIEVKQNLNFNNNDGSNVKPMQDAYKKGIQDAIRQSPLQSQGS